MSSVFIYWDNSQHLSRGIEAVGGKRPKKRREGAQWPVTGVRVNFDQYTAS